MEICLNGWTVRHYVLGVPQPTTQKNDTSGWHHQHTEPSGCLCPQDPSRNELEDRNHLCNSMSRLTLSLLLSLFLCFGHHGTTTMSCGDRESCQHRRGVMGATSVKASRHHYYVRTLSLPQIGGEAVNHASVTEGGKKIMPNRRLPNAFFHRLNWPARSSTQK